MVCKCLGITPHEVYERMSPAELSFCISAMGSLAHDGVIL